MRTLFARILGLFVISVVVASVGLILIEYFIDFTDRGRFEGGNLSLMLGEARLAYERNGPAGLAGFLRRVQAATGVAGSLAGPDGRDLLTGEDRSSAFSGPEDRAILRLRRMTFLIRAVDGQGYAFILERPLGFAQFRGLLWFVVVMIALCYVLSRQVATPIRALQKAVHLFGSGDLHARVSSKRRDELGQLAGTFDQMAEKIESLVDNQRRLLRDVSHELRSPLSRLRIAVELARTGPDAAEALNRIENEAERLNILVGEVLSLARSESAVAAPSFLSIDLKRLLEEVVWTCAPEAESGECALVLEPGDAPPVRADEELIRRAVENVLRNAIWYSPPNAPVTIRLERQPRHVVIRIRDRGPGVPEASVGRIFEPFYRVNEDRSRASGGAGLGLAIARKSLELHHGEIRARNAYPGLEMEIRVPL